MRIEGIIVGLMGMLFIYMVDLSTYPSFVKLMADCLFLMGLLLFILSLFLPAGRIFYNR